MCRIRIEINYIIIFMKENIHKISQRIRNNVAPIIIIIIVGLGAPA